jgi:hypothetical protein
VHIDKDQLICGVQAVLLRDSLPESQSFFIPINIGIKMGLTKIKSKMLAELLESEGYIEPENERNIEGYYHLTIKGGSLKLASAAKPIRRETAEKSIEAFLDRVNEVNTNPNYLYETSDVMIFGSFLSEKEYINDVDLAFDLYLKSQYHGELLDTMIKNKIESAINHGRNFSTYFEEMYWPYKEIMLKLKSRSRILSFHPLKDGILDKIEKKIIYRKCT